MHSTEDRTAKANIRDTAIALFGRDGFEAVPLRTIAAHAAISQALIIKHYGSRAGLIEAADEYVLGVAERLVHSITVESGGNDTSQATRDSVAQRLAGSAIGPYLARLLTSHETRARQAFERLVDFTRALVDQLAEGKTIASQVQRHHLAVVLLVHDLSTLVLRARITEALGVDPLGERGAAIWSHTVRGLYADEALVAAEASYG